MQKLSLRDSCGARNYLLAVARIISTAAPLLTSLYLPQAALSRKAASSATPASFESGYDSDLFLMKREIEK